MSKKEIERYLFSLDKEVADLRRKLRRFETNVLARENAKLKFDKEYDAPNMDQEDKLNFLADLIRENLTGNEKFPEQAP